jgi:LCP family protein required for cell wall assembly
VHEHGPPSSRRWGRLDRVGHVDSAATPTAEEPELIAHARQIPPETRPTDRRRLAAAGLSAVLPGLGQALNRRMQLAALFVVPSLLLVLTALVLIQLQSPARLLAWIVAPQVLGTLLTLNLVVLAWRLIAVGQAFLDTSRSGPTGRLGVVGIVVIAVLVVLPHLVVYRYGTILGDTFARIFQGAGFADDPGVAPGPVPAEGQRINVLLVGVDKLPNRAATLTDTMMVASLDPAGKTVSLLSVPRDMIDTPLGDGNAYGPKLNSLLGYADAHRDQFPKGGMRTLEDAIGALLDIPIHYYARIDFVGFIDMVDAVGGVDVTVAKGFQDPGYDGFGFGVRSWSITAGPHHLDGPNALAFARSRKAAGESDFTRAARQQQILIALRDKVTSGGNLLFQLPGLLDAVGRTIRSDVPVDKLPALAAIMEEISHRNVVSAVIRFPLVHPKSTRYGDSQEPDLTAIRAVAAALFSPPGTTPKDWTPPK